jgi:hypothetical protein
MDQETRWLTRYNEVKTFIETNKRNPSKHDDEERGLYLNWIKHNRKLFAAGELKPDRVELFEKLLVLCEKYKRVNQWG